MNSVTMIGRLTDDPNLKHFEGRAICEMRIAVDNTPQPTTFIDVETFDGAAYACAEYLSKGRRVGVSGKLALKEWRDGEKRLRRRYVIIGRVEFLERRRQEEVDKVPIGSPPEDPSPPEDQTELALAA